MAVTRGCELMPRLGRRRLWLTKAAAEVKVADDATAAGRRRPRVMAPREKAVATKVTTSAETTSMTEAEAETATAAVGGGGGVDDGGTAERRPQREVVAHAMWPRPKAQRRLWSAQAVVDALSAAHKRMCGMRIAVERCKRGRCAGGVAYLQLEDNQVGQRSATDATRTRNG